MKPIYIDVTRPISTGDFFSQATEINTLIFWTVLIAAAAFILKPRFLTVLLLIFIYLLPRAGFLVFFGLNYYPLPIGYILVAFIMLRWLWRLLVGRIKQKTGNPIRRIFPLYIGIAIMAIIIGVLNKGNIRIMVLEITFYFLAFFVFFMVLDMFQEKDCLKIFIGGIPICAFLVSLYGILLLIYGQPLLINNVTYNAATYVTLIGQFIYAKRTISSYGDPNTLSAQLMVFCGILGSLALSGKFRILKRIFFLIALILTVVCIYFASSRASLIGMFILLLIFAVSRIKKTWLYLPILTAGYIMLIEPVRAYYDHRLFRTGLPSTDLRITYIRTFFDILMHIPFGCGFGNSIDGSYSPVPAINIWHGFNSFYIQLLSRTGIQGLIVFAIMFYLILRYLFLGISSIEAPNVRYFVFGAACGVVVQQFNFLSNNVYHTPGGMWNFWIMCGMLIAITNVYKKPSG